MSDKNSIIGIKPLQFVHVLDCNSNITHVERGPKTLVLQTNEKLVCGPLPFVVVPPGHYCVVQDPCSKNVPGKQCELKHGYTDVRFHKEPFFLYPGESLQAAPEFGRGSTDYRPAIKKLPVISANHALRLEAVLDHKDGDVLRKSGDRWQLEGPLTYYPTPQTEILEMVKPRIIRPGQALRMKALQECVDRSGKKRVTGEEWLITEIGAYLPGVYEQVTKVEKAHTLTEDKALHLRATQHVEKFLGKKRLPGDEWLVTVKEAECLMCPVGVEVVKEVQKTVLSKGQYCVVMNPVDDDGHPKLGQKVLRRGVFSFFLQPGETLERGGTMSCYVLEENEAVVLQARLKFSDKDSEGEDLEREPGEKWMIFGPAEYVPPIEVKVISRRKAIALAKNEGVYVRDVKSGEVRAVMGQQSYLLTEDEVLWEKELPDQVEEMLRKGGGMGSEDIRKISYFDSSIDPAICRPEGRDRTRVVTYRCPINTACQVYNYLRKTARVIFGPDLVVLGPHENFNVLSLSAGKPKKAHALKSLVLMLGPDFITDVIEVETSDHARLQIKLAFNNYFEFDKTDPKTAAKLFAIPDFIGFACKNVGSRIRASVAHVPFDEFHRNSAEVIRRAIFEDDSEKLCFPGNNLVVTNVDIQSIEPVDLKMRDSLMKSVQMAIEISTKSIEAAASHEAQRTEQIAKGELERQKLQNEKEAEKERAKLFELQAATAAVESTGQAVAEARGHAEKTRIECQSEIEGAKLKALAAQIAHEAELETQQKLRSSEISYLRDQNELVVDKEKRMADVEVNKFSSMVDTLGQGTISAMATAGQTQKVELLASLGLQTTLFTDGNSPINLFNTANGLIAENGF